MLIGQPSKRAYFLSIGQVGIAVGLISISTFFIALVVAYGLVLSTKAHVHVAIPPSLWISTVVIIASSVTYEAARYALRRGHVNAFRTRLHATTILGVTFLVSQLWSWWTLKQNGVYMQSNPHGSVFYVFTGAHGLHLFSGVLGLFYLLVRSRTLDEDDESKLRRTRNVVGIVGLYWHFMDVLWLILFGILLAWSA